MEQQEIVITQIRSAVGRPGDQRRTLEALGLGKIGRSVKHRVSPSVQGMLRKVSHLVVAEFA